MMYCGELISNHCHITVLYYAIYTIRCRVRVWDHKMREESEPIMGIWGQSHQRIPVADPVVRGVKPLKLKAFFAFAQREELANLS